MPLRPWHPAVVLPGQRPRPATSPPVPVDPVAGLAPDDRDRLPNLIGIGAAKCGTSALHAYLSAHPDIGMTTHKEVKHFGSAEWLSGLKAYAELFDATFTVRGETSPTYSMDPYIPGVPEQMAAVLPAARFVYLVGDPLRRIVSHWAEHRALTFERRSLEEALADAENPFNPYVAASRYGHQLSRYLDVVGAERVLVVDQRDLRDRRRETLQRIFTFAGVDGDHWVPEYEAEHNAAAEKLEPNRLGRWIVDRRRLRAAVRRRALVRPLTARRMAPVEPPPPLRARLERILEPDAAQFRKLTGMAFDHWCV